MDIDKIYNLDDKITKLAQVIQKHIGLDIDIDLIVTVIIIIVLSADSDAQDTPQEQQTFPSVFIQHENDLHPIIHTTDKIKVYVQPTNLIQYFINMKKAIFGGVKHVKTQMKKAILDTTLVANIVERVNK